MLNTIDSIVCRHASKTSLNCNFSFFSLNPTICSEVSQLKHAVLNKVINKKEMLHFESHLPGILNLCGGGVWGGMVM